MRTPAWQPAASDRALAWALGGGALAFVSGPAGVYFARGPDPVFALVDAIGHAFPGQAHGMLRARVLTTLPRDPADHALIQVCGRKLGAGVDPAPGPVPSEVWTDLGPAARASHDLHLQTSRVDAPIDVSGLSDADLARLLDGLAPVDASLAARTRDRPVAAVLVGPDGQVLEAARNTNGSNRVRHAEVNLLARWEARGHGPIPAGCVLWVSVQCCRMCAARIVRAAADPRALTVRYVHPEPGRFGTDTALQRLGIERPA